MLTSPLRGLHSDAGAHLTASGAHTSVLTYGDVPGEYRAGRAGALLLDTTERGLVRLAGADTESFLHRLLANRVKGLAVGGGNRNLLLTGKGKVVHVFDLARTGEAAFEASTPHAEAPRLIESLDVYLFSEDTTLTDATEQHAPLELVGPRAASVVAAALGADVAAGLPTESHQASVATHTELGAVRVTAMPSGGAAGFRLAALPHFTAALWSALVSAGATPGGLIAWDSLRAEHVVAAAGRDISPEVYPQEARLEDAFSLDKGCYIGQEVVAKIDTYGGLNKRLMLLRVSHDDPIAAGTRLVVREGGEERDLGLVTSWAYSFELDGGVVLGYVKRKHQDVGRVFELVAPGATPGGAPRATATIQSG